jgi:hypothetical protein
MQAGRQAGRQEKIDGSVTPRSGACRAGARGGVVHCRLLQAPRAAQIALMNMSVLCLFGSTCATKQCSDLVRSQMHCGQAAAQSRESGAHVHVRAFMCVRSHAQSICGRMCVMAVPATVHHRGGRMCGSTPWLVLWHLHLFCAPGCVGHKCGREHTCSTNRCAAVPRGRGMRGGCPLWFGAALALPAYCVRTAQFWGVPY